MADDQCVLPPSPNWYCSSAASCSLTEAYAFVAKKRVYVLDVSRDTPVFKGQFMEHADRTSAVVCCPHQGYSNLCVSGSDDKTVKIWDIDTKLVAGSHNAHQAKITCICWSPVTSDLIISADEKGTIIAWRHGQNVVYSACPIQEYIFSIAASQHSGQLAAAGYKNGLIVVLHLDELGITVAHRLRGHDGDVHSIAWCPVSVDQLDLGPLQKKALASEGNLIISGSRDQTIRLWDTLEGKLISIFNLPKRSSQKWRDRHDWQSKDRLWLAVCWPSALPNKIISSSHSGELLLWDLSAASGPEQVQSFGHGHSRIVFNISCNKEGTKVISCSMDRQIIVWDLHASRSQLHSIPTLGGFVYALDISPLDPGTLAIGVGDNMIRVWNTASTTGAYDSLTLWQGIKSKVQMVSWHPHKEALLAFGTDDGQVGIYNTVSKKPEVFASYHKKTVYSVSWGPPCPAVKDKDDRVFHVYSCAGDGSVLEHRPGYSVQDAIDVNALIKTTNEFKHKLMCRTDVAWNTNGTAMALGNDDGTIEVFAPPTLRRVCTISVHKKIITRLAWHHGYGDDSEEGEERYQYWLASGSNESTIHIHDLNSVLGNSSTSSSVSGPPITSSHRQLVGHSGRITALSWSPHHCNMIVSGSYDGTAQVWDVDKSQPVANYRDHVGRVMSVRWSYLDPDVIYSGGEDGTVRPWRVSTQHHTQPPVTERHSSRGGSKSSKNKKKAKPKGKENTMLKDTKDEVLEMVEDVRNKMQETEMRGTGLEKNTGVSQNLESNNLNDSQNISKEESLNQRDRTPELLSWRKPLESTRAETNVPDSMKSLPSIDLTIDHRNDELHDTVLLDDNDDDETSSLTTQDSGPTLVVSKSRSEAAKKKKKIKSMFPLSAVADNKSKSSTQQECIALAQYVCGTQAASSLIEPDTVVPGESSHVNLGFFADRRSAYRMVVTEGRHHSSANNLDYQLQLEVWKGNLGGALEMAIKARQLTDWLVALSPLAGHDVWLNTAELFADQLASQGIHQRAVLYYLSCHKVYRAIDVYKNQSMYREAIGLAKVRLSPSDPVLTDLYCSWARKLEMENSYEQAAKCYIAAGLPAEAARVLSIRGDQSSLTTALQVSVISGEHQLASSLAVRVLHICLGSGNWDSAHKALALCSGLEGHLLALCVHELLVDELLREGYIQDDDFKDKSLSEFFTTKPSENERLESLIDNTSERDPEKLPWLLDSPRKDWFIGHVLKAWDRVGAFTTERLLQSAVEQLTSYCQSNVNENLSMKQILIRISYDISLGLLHGINQDIYTCSLPWLQALDACCKSSFLGFFLLPHFLCVLLLPRGVQSLRDITAIGRAIIETREKDSGSKPHAMTSDDEIFSFFDAFYSVMCLYKIWWRDSDVLSRFVGHTKQAKESDPNISDDKVLSHKEGSTIEFHTANATHLSNFHDNASVEPQPPVGEERQDGSVTTSTLHEKSDTLSDIKDVAKEPFTSCSSSRKITFNERLDLSSVLARIRNVLLREDLVVCSALKKQLLEVKKEVILLRSRRILDSVVVTKNPTNQRRNPKKKEKFNLASNEPAENLGAKSTGTSEEDLLGSERGNKNKGNEVMVGQNDGEIENSPPSSFDEDETISSEKCFGTVTSREPLDVRYKESAWTLELMQTEERRLEEQLFKYPLKALPFPDPTETAMIIGHLCSHLDTLTCREPTVLYQLGLEAVNLAIEHAQWHQELKCLEQLQLKLTELRKSLCFSE